MKHLRLDDLKMVYLISLILLITACSAKGTEAVAVQPTATEAVATEVIEVEPTATAPLPTEAPTEELATAVPTEIPTDTPQPTAVPTDTAVPIERFAVDGILPLYSTEPVIEHGANGAWDRNLDIAAVLYHDGQFHAFLNRFPGWPTSSFGLSYHTSPDGVNWTTVSDDPVFSQADLPDQTHMPIGSSVHLEEDGTWVQYFFTWNKGAGRSVNQIGRATAPDPLGPWTADEEYVLQPGPQGSWDAMGVARPYVIKNEDGYVMYYAGKNGREMIGMATSPDGINWTKHDDPTTTDKLYAESDPVFLPSNEGGKWDQRSVSDPHILKTADGWVMSYASTIGNGVRVGYAISEDGIMWKRSDEPLQSFADVPNNTALWSTELVYQDGMYYLFGEVNTGQFSGIYVATQAGALIP